MKITINRTIHLRTAETFLSIERNVLRKDIQDYLNGNGYGNKVVDKGIRNYLKSIGIYDASFALTKYGNSVKEAGIFKEKEMGKYKIWLDDNRIVFIQRIAPDRRPETIRDLELALRKEEHFCLPTNKEDFYKFKVLTEIIYGKFINSNDRKNDIITETIEITENEAITIFGGQLIEDVQNKSVKANVEFPGISLFDMAEMIFTDDWNKTTNRLKFRLDKLENNTIANFELEERPYTWWLFNVKINNWPVEPYDKSEAVEWRNNLLNKELAKDYLTEKEFDRLVLSVNEKDGFSAYNDALDNPKMENYLNEKTERYSPEFWHLCAPMDLCPGIPKEVVVDKFEIGRGDCSMLEIVRRINIVDPDVVFYCDSYTDTSYQQKTIAAFLDACGAKKAKFLVTVTGMRQDNNKKRDSYLENHRKDIKVKILKQRQHRRCIVFYKNGDLQIWNLDDSPDFIRYDGGKRVPTPTDMGRIERPVVFTKVSDKVLDPEIVGFIRQEVKIV